MVERSRIPKVLRTIAAIFILTAFCLGCAGTNAKEGRDCPEGEKSQDKCTLQVVKKYPVNTWPDVDKLNGRFFIMLSEIFLFVTTFGLVVYRATGKKNEKLLLQVIVCAVCAVLAIMDGSLELWYSNSAIPNTHVESWTAAGAFLFVSVFCFVIDMIIVFFEYRDTD